MRVAFYEQKIRAEMLDIAKCDIFDGCKKRNVVDSVGRKREVAGDSFGMEDMLPNQRAVRSTKSNEEYSNG